MSALFASEPYGVYLDSHFTEEVAQRDGRFFVSTVRYRNDAGSLTEIGRTEHREKDGFAELELAIAAAQAARRSYLDCAAEEMAGAAQDLREKDRAYHLQSYSYEAALDPFDDPSFSLQDDSLSAMGGL